MLQQAQVGERQAAPVPTGKGEGHPGGAEAFSDDLIYAKNLHQNSVWIFLVEIFVIFYFPRQTSANCSP